MSLMDRHTPCWDPGGGRARHDEDVLPHSCVPVIVMDCTRVSRCVCSVAGDGWARRAEDAVLHGCIPVIIMDAVEEKFSGIVDYSQFSLRIPEADVEQVCGFVLAVGSSCVDTSGVLHGKAVPEPGDYLIEAPAGAGAPSEGYCRRSAAFPGKTQLLQRCQRQAGQLRLARSIVDRAGNCG